MATLSASWTFADGDGCGVSIDIENDYPDALSEGVKTCVDLLRAVMVSGIYIQGPDDEDE